MPSVTFDLTIGPASGFTLSLVGGWRINQPYCKGGLAIDFATMKCWTLGHAQTVPLIEYQLSAMGSGLDFAAYPQVNQTKSYGNCYTIDGWDYSVHGNQLYAGGLHWQDGLLWMSGKGFYSAGGSYPHTVVKKFSLGASAVLAETITISDRPCQAFGGGFVKGGAQVMPGCGGYESGQGCRSGPCWMQMDGTIVNEFPSFNAAKELREKRGANYTPDNPDAWFVPPDDDVGYWFAGRVWGGGLVINGTTCFFVDQGTGPVGYSYQNDTFSATPERMLYKYDGHFGTWEPFPHKTVSGSDINGNLVYLLLRDAWVLGGYDPCPVLACFQVN